MECSTASLRTAQLCDEDGPADNILPHPPLQAESLKPECNSAKANPHEAATVTPREAEAFTLGQSEHKRKV